MVTLDLLKKFGNIDYSNDDDKLTIMLESSVSIIEKYTSLSMSDKSITYTSDGSPNRIYLKPISSINGEVKVINHINYTEIISKEGVIYTVNISDSNNKNLENCAYKLAVSMYENIEIDSANLPFDLQIMLNQYRNDSFIS